MNRFQIRIFTLLEKGDADDPLSKGIDWLIIAIILLNALAAIVETMPGMSASHGRWFQNLEVISVAIFTVEYLLRVWSSTAEGHSPVWGRARFMLRPMLLVDLVAILPFYLGLAGVDLRQVRLLRLVRMVRLAKLGRYSRALQALGRGLAARRLELSMAGMVAVLMLVVSATLIYHAEHGAQPDVFASIPASLWWAVTTMTTVGYGDAYPVTALGRVVGAGVQVLGVAVMAVPTGLLAASFLEGGGENQPLACPHCGASLEESADG